MAVNTDINSKLVSTSEQRPPTAISLFCGAGGMSLGFKKAGFDILWANDDNHDACETYRQNLGDYVVCDKIGNVNPDSMPSVDVVFGGPPCQGFSVAGKMDFADPRSKLVWEFVRIIQAKRPKCFVMENVRALGSLKKWKPLLDALLDSFHKIGYTTDLKVLNSADYGVSQKRERVFILGTRLKIMPLMFPEPSHSCKWVPARDVLAGLPEPGELGNEGACTARITLSKYPVLRRSPYAGMLVNGQGRPVDLDKPAPTMHARMGGNKTPIIDLVQLHDPTVKPWVVKYHEDIMQVKEPGLEDPPKYWRRITVREAARIQSFPDSFQFSGSRGSQFKQVGNAVPPILAEKVASTIANLLAVNGPNTEDEIQNSSNLQIPMVI